MLSCRSLIKHTVNNLISPLGFEIRRISSRSFQEYLDFRSTMAGAKAKGVSVGVYIDATFNVQGATQETIEQMRALGVFSCEIKSLCEIGPGSGRYLEKVIAVCNPTSCEIYETAEDWRKWLATQYPVIAHEVDGRSLCHTRSGSIDLAQAHKVFPGLTALAIINYFSEISRVVRRGGKAVFDLLTEACLNGDALKQWFNPWTGFLDSMMSEDYTLEFFRQKGFTYDGSFFIPMKPGRTHYFVFTRQ